MKNKWNIYQIQYSYCRSSIQCCKILFSSVQSLHDNPAEISPSETVAPTPQITNPRTTQTLTSVTVSAPWPHNDLTEDHVVIVTAGPDQRQESLSASRSSINMGVNQQTVIVLQPPTVGVAGNAGINPTPSMRSSTQVAGLEETVVNTDIRLFETAKPGRLIGMSSSASTSTMEPRIAVTTPASRASSDSTPNVDGEPNPSQATTVGYQPLPSSRRERMSSVLSIPSREVTEGIVTTPPPRSLQTVAGGTGQMGDSTGAMTVPGSSSSSMPFSEESSSPLPRTPTPTLWMTPAAVTTNPLSSASSDVQPGVSAISNSTTVASTLNTTIPVETAQTMLSASLQPTLDGGLIPGGGRASTVDLSTAEASEFYTGSLASSGANSTWSGVSSTAVTSSSELYSSTPALSQPATGMPLATPELLVSATKDVLSGTMSLDQQTTTPDLPVLSPSSLFVVRSDSAMVSSTSVSAIPTPSLPTDIPYVKSSMKSSVSEISTVSSGSKSSKDMLVVSTMPISEKGSLDSAVVPTTKPEPVSPTLVSTAPPSIKFTTASPILPAPTYTSILPTTIPTAITSTEASERTPPPVYITLFMKKDWQDMCLRSSEYKTILAQITEKQAQQNDPEIKVIPDQVVFMEEKENCDTDFMAGGEPNGPHGNDGGAVFPGKPGIPGDKPHVDPDPDRPKNPDDKEGDKDDETADGDGSKVVTPSMEEEAGKKGFDTKAPPVEEVWGREEYSEGKYRGLVVEEAFDPLMGAPSNQIPRFRGVYSLRGKAEYTHDTWARVKREAGAVALSVYLQDEKGTYDQKLTTLLARAFQEHGTKTLDGTDLQGQVWYSTKMAPHLCRVCYAV